MPKKKMKESLRIRLSRNKIAWTKMPNARLHAHHFFIRRQWAVYAGRWTFLKFFCKREHLLGIYWFSYKLQQRRTDECQEREHMKEIFKLIYWREILWYSPESHPHLISNSWHLWDHLKTRESFKNSATVKNNGYLKYHNLLDVLALLSFNYTIVKLEQNSS